MIFRQPYWMFVTATIGIVAQASSVAAPLPACAPIRNLDQARLLSYVTKKYGIPRSVELSITETTAVSEACHRKLLFTGKGPLGAFSLSLYASPDLRYLSPDLFDSYTDPDAEKQAIAQKLMGELAEGDFASSGRVDAPVTVVVFADFQCPYCRHTAELLREEPLIRDGTDVRVVFRHFPLPQHEWAQQAAVAAACAGFQNAMAFWAFHDALFSVQSSITSGNLELKLQGIGSKIPSLDQQLFSSCVHKQMSLGVVLQDKELAERLGVSGTPTIFLDGQIVSGLDDPKELHDELLKKVRASQSGTRIK